MENMGFVMMESMGFGVVWRMWMELLVFQSKMSVLVNGSPTEEFVVEKRLRQVTHYHHFYLFWWRKV